ncbi:protoporphyrinogen oxidase [Rhodobacteraceae bacterium N5(2021)]|uniref:Protoporphyrinogen oxidase n=1 Tax=Gymnodinialimonas phycosphaerae TaxID=2841589 RepID=A0A975TUL2_9RHOB|nr:flavodoxin domain-containing protein [Gymnodinialimonas phycosphaerae]MBY4894918.1 protoporphyrinogen oxidase [Gymnodinialimonas phycosphaerae]
MKVLILYATVEGQTGKIARFVQEQIEALGHEATLANADDPAELPIDGADAVVLAAPVHQRRHPRNFEALVSARKDDLAARKVLMLTVSLNAAFAEGREEAADYLLEMKMRTGLEPTAELLVAGAVRTGEYDYFAKQVVEHVVMRGRDYDRSVDEHEFTDWDALATALKAFLKG